MARKSRRQLNVEKAVITTMPDISVETKIKAAGYVRISGENAEGDSIQTQILMIGQYVSEHPEFELVDTYVDDGFTGTNFDRPDFQRLMEDIRHGLVQCIIVKDLSRFGRNYIETGYYIETILPQLNIRLIAINDRFDSSREEDLQGLRLPIKNMVNSMYAMDLSKKFSDSYDLHFQMGTYKLREGTYGYILDRKNNVLVEDPDTSGIVKTIFRWSKQGKNTNTIANLLNLVDAELPSAAKLRLENKRTKTCYHEWVASNVYRILTLPTYTGDMVYGRSRERKCEKVFTRKTDKDKHIVWPNTHVPLVSHRDFDQICHYYEVKLKKREQSEEITESKKRLSNSLGKKVKCKECGITMLYQRFGHFNSRQQGYAYAEYVCEHQRKKGCGKKINEDYLKVIVLDQVKKYIRVVCDQKQMAKDMISGIKKSGKLASLDTKTRYAQRKIGELEKTLERLYVDFTEETIGEEEYKTFQYHYLQEKEDLLNNLKEYKSQEGILRQRLNRYLDLEQHLEPYLNSSDYVQELIDELVETVYIAEDNSIEMVFRCEDIFSQYLDVLEEEPE